MILTQDSNFQINIKSTCQLLFCVINFIIKLKYLRTPSWHNPLPPIMNANTAKWQNKWKTWIEVKTNNGLKDETRRCQQAWPWPSEIFISVKTNFIKQCLLSRTPRSKFNTTDSSNQVTRKFQIRVTPVNFSWGRPTIAWSWTDLDHRVQWAYSQEASVTISWFFPELPFPMRIIRAKFLPNQHFWDLGCQRVLFECPEVKKKDTFLLNHLARKISTAIIQKYHLFYITFTQDQHFQIIIKSTF